ncbi:MAG TPA: hypothetical protein PKD61_14450, partial [Polyangiaceae bacterium]|nr:hypothetical protein [Polyangiaceae bacterium]
LPTSYATQPRLAAHVRGALLPDSGCVYLDGSGLDGILPVAGELWIDLPIEKGQAQGALANERGAAHLAPARRAAVAAYVLEHAALLFSKNREGIAPDDAEAYAAHLALLGAPPAVALTSASGDTFTTQEVHSRLQQKQPIWYSNRAGSDFGEFPDAEPQFVLEGSHPLVRVLERIAPNSLRELGGVPRPSEQRRIPRLAPRSERRRRKAARGHRRRERAPSTGLNKFCWTCAYPASRWHGS